MPSTVKHRLSTLSRYGRLSWLSLAFHLLCLAPQYLSAQESAVKPDIRLVIDVSGSMKRNDPEDLRQPAVELLVRLMPEGGKAGVWTFAQQVNMLVPHKIVDEQWRALGRSKAAQINSVGLFTNIGAALEKAAFDARAPADERYATSVILLTDGMVDISKKPEDNQKEWQRIVDEVIPELKQANYVVHTVALSASADSELMEKIALATDGTAAVAHSADDLMKIFLQAFAIAAPAQELPLQNNRFVVDSSVEELTALIFRQDPEQITKLIGPDGQTFSARNSAEDVNWHRADSYDLITVAQPLEGEWQILADLDPASRITVVSNLSLRVKQLPSNAFLGAEESLTFVFQEDGKTVSAAEFLSLLDLQVELEFAEGNEPLQTLWQKGLPQGTPADGIYSVALPALDAIGTYRLTLTADGKTFKRQFSQQIVVREPFTARVEDYAANDSPAQYVLSVSAHSDLIAAAQTQIVATIIKPDGRKLVKPLGLGERGRWQTLLHLDQRGDHQVVVQVTGEDTKQRPFQYTLTPLLLNHDPDAIFTSATEPPEAPATPEPVVQPHEPAQPEPAAPPEAAATNGLPAWLKYLLLGLANVVLFGGGYWLYRRYTGGHEGEAELHTEAVVEDGQGQLLGEEAEPLLAMDDGEEEPPMEDLDTLDEQEPPIDIDEEPTDEPFDDLDDLDEEDAPAAPELDEEDQEQLQPAADEFAADDQEPTLDDVLVEQFAADASEEEKADFAEEILKAQGLDLAEDELDDAISNLIDELDGSREPAEDGADEADEDAER